MKLICERIDAELTSPLVEEVNGKKQMFIEGVFLQAGIKNRNGRIYPEQIMSREVTRYIKEYVEKDRALGELNHPPSPIVNPERACILIKELRQEGSNWRGKALVTSTPLGALVRGLVEDGVKFGVSSRGVGSLRESNGAKIVQDDFKLFTAADIVHDPSAPAAFVNGIYESAEWIYENGNLTQIQAAEYKTQLDRASRSPDKKKLSEAALKAFNDFVSKLSR
ncbi:MAG: hypothetical protein DDT26_00323 [Dehalococcoidia bacterium]|nr:hypothetical protein [Chloroflexota bacterium]